MGTDILLAALILSPSCEVAGKLYEQAAIIRDTGVALARAKSVSRVEEARKALDRVYAVPAMTPRDWRHFASGVCSGTEVGEPRALIPV